LECLLLRRKQPMELSHSRCLLQMFILVGLIYVNGAVFANKAVKKSTWALERYRLRVASSKKL